MRKSSFIVEAGFRIAIFRDLVSYLGLVSDSLIVPILVAFILGALAKLQNWITLPLSLLGVQQEPDDVDDVVEAEIRDVDQA